MSDEFRKLVFEISQNLSESDQETLVYIYRLPDSFKNVPPLRPLTELERRGVFSSSTPDSLSDVLATIHRHDLVGLLRQYKPGPEVVQCVSGATHVSTTECALAHAKLMEKQLVEIRDSFCTYDRTLTARTVKEWNTSKERIEAGLKQLQSGLQYYIMPVLSDMALGKGGSSSTKPISAVKPKIQQDPDLQKNKPVAVLCMHGQKVLPPPSMERSFHHFRTKLDQSSSSTKDASVNPPKVSILPGNCKQSDSCLDHIDLDPDEVICSPEVHKIDSPVSVGRYFAKTDLLANGPGLQNTSERHCCSTPTSAKAGLAGNSPRHVLPLKNTHPKSSIPVPVGKARTTPILIATQSRLRHVRKMSTSLSEISDSRHLYSGSSSSSLDSGFWDTEEWRTCMHSHSQPNSPFTGSPLRISLSRTTEAANCRKDLVITI